MLDVHEKLELLQSTGMTLYDANKLLHDGIDIYEDTERDLFLLNCIEGGINRDEAIQIWDELDRTVYKGVHYRLDFWL